MSLYAFVGVIMLIGIVKKNGIMMVDFALEAQRNEQKDAKSAIHEACMVRFRPIMMTTMAALLGTLPIALGIGAGAEARQPLGLAVVGGLLFSQILTLYVTPVFFVYMDQFQARFKKGFRFWRRKKDSARIVMETCCRGVALAKRQVFTGFFFNLLKDFVRTHRCASGDGTDNR